MGREEGPEEREGPGVGREEDPEEREGLQFLEDFAATLGGGERLSLPGDSGVQEQPVQTMMFLPPRTSSQWTFPFQPKPC